MNNFKSMTTYKVIIPVAIEPKLNSPINSLTEEAGGCTVQSAVGVWRNTTESVTIYEWTSNMGLGGGIELLASAMRDAGEEAVFVERRTSEVSIG